MSVFKLPKAKNKKILQMECETERPPLGVFKCQLCALTAPYSYVGQKPPDTQSVVLLEESYVMKDPFTPDKGRFLVLGSRCSLCSRLVCVGPVGPSRGRNCAFWRILEHSCAWGLFYQCTFLQSGPKPSRAKPCYTHLIDEETEECSLFYSKRFCLPCVRENLDAFPREIRQDLEKRKGPSKSPASQPGSRT